MIFRPAEYRFGHRQHIKLIVAAEPAIALIYPPSDPAGKKAGADLITVRVADDSPHVGRVGGNFEPRRIQHFGVGTERVTAFNSALRYQRN